MRRLLILIPIVTLLLGGLLFLWNSFIPPEPSKSRPPPAKAGNPAPKAEPSLPPPVPKPPGTGQLRVIAQEADGSGLPKAKVTVLNEDKPDSRMEFETEADGGRTILGIPAGHYAVTVRFPGRITSGGHAEVVVDSVAEIRVRMLLGATIRGSALNRRGEPIAAARLSLFLSATEQIPHPDLAPLTDAAGAYEILGIPPQEISLTVYHPRHRTLKRTGIVLRSADETQHIDLILEEGTRLAGRVLNDAGEPIAKATVMGTNEFSFSAQSDAQGCFEIFGLGEQPVLLAARASGYGERYLRGIPPGTMQVEIRLPRAGLLRGRVEADPMPSVFAVLLTYFDREVGREMKLQMIASLAPDGTFDARDVPPGTYGLEIEAPGYESLDRPQIVVKPGEVLRDLVVRLRKKT